MEVVASDAEPEVRNQESFLLSLKVRESMHDFDTRDSSRFGLVNRDFGAHNVLGDDDFNIVAFIDFDGVVAAPLATVVQLPIFTDVWRPVPGYVGIRELAVARENKTASFCPAYVEVVLSSSH